MTKHATHFMTWMKPSWMTSTARAVACSAVLAACGDNGNTNSKAKITAAAEFADAAPETSALTLDSEGVSSSPTREAAGGASTIAGTTKQVVDRLNAAVTEALQNVEAAIATAPTESEGNVRTWLSTKQGVTFKLAVKKLGDNQFAWKLQAKKEASADDAYKIVLGGKLRRDKNAGPRRGAGTVGIDLTNLHDVTADTAAATPQTGKLFAAFRHNKQGAHLVYRMKDFKADASATTPAESAYFSGFRVFAKEIGGRKLPAISWVRAGGIANVTHFAETAPTDLNETIVVRLRRFIGLGGWGRAVIKGGNVAANTAIVVRECWNSPLTGSEAVYHRETWRCATPLLGNLQTCEFVAEYSYPEQIVDATDDPEALPTKNRFLANCFEGAVKNRLAEQVAEEPALTDDPSEVDEMDDAAPVDDEGDKSALTPAIETADANTLTVSAEVSAEF